MAAKCKAAGWRYRCRLLLTKRKATGWSCWLLLLLLRECCKPIAWLLCLAKGSKAAGGLLCLAKGSKASGMLLLRRMAKARSRLRCWLLPECSKSSRWRCRLLLLLLAKAKAGGRLLRCKADNGGRRRAEGWRRLAETRRRLLILSEPGHDAGHGKTARGPGLRRSSGWSSGAGQPLRRLSDARHHVMRGAASKTRH